MLLKSVPRVFALVAAGLMFTLSTAKAAGEATIEVSEASYGLNRGNNQAGNATDYVKKACDGKRSCSFPVQNAAGKIGDHFPGKTKDFDVTYICGDEQKTVNVPGEAVGKSAFLTCAKSANQ